MEFFGYTTCGPQNYIKDVLRDEYQEPMKQEHVSPLMAKIASYSTMSKKVQRPDINTIRLIDCYLGRVNGFAYGSFQRFKKMKRKGVIKPTGPGDIYRMPPTTSIEYGWWLNDPELAMATWHNTSPRYPQPTSPNTLILDIVRKNNKYATLF